MYSALDRVIQSDYFVILRRLAMNKSNNVQSGVIQQIKAFLIDILLARADYYQQQHDKFKS